MSSAVRQRMFQTQLDFGRAELARAGAELGFVVRVSSERWPAIGTPVCTIRGLVDGIAVAVQRFARRSGLFVDHVAAAVWPPLDLGVSLRLEGRVGRAVRDLFGSEDVQTGDDAFDAPLRIQADEAPRVLRLLTSPELRHKLHWFAGSCRDFELTDAGIRCISSTFHGARDWRIDVPALLDVVRVLRASSAAVPPATALLPWADALRSFASTYGLAVRSCPLAAEGDLGNLRCGVFFRRLGSRRYAVELGVVVAALDSLQVTMRPRHPRMEVAPFELAKPLEEMVVVARSRGEDPRIDDRFVTECVRARRSAAARIVPHAMRVKMAELQEHFDVELRYGVLSIRKEVTGEDPAQLASWIDLAADGARVVVRQAGAGYRD